MTRSMVRLKPALAALLTLFCLTAQAGLLGNSEPRFLPVDQAFQPRASLSDGAVVVTWRIAENYYLYRHALEFAAPGDATLGQPVIPEGISKTDKFFGQVEIYRNRLTVRIPVTAETPPAKITIQYQGCADAGLCYPPQTRTLKLVSTSSGESATANTGTATAATPGQSGGYVSEQDQIASTLARAGLGWIVLSFLGLGLLLAFTPCVLPMIPILSGVIVGNQGRASTWRGFTLSLVYVLAMAAAYTVFGVLAGLFGTNLQALLQAPWALVPFALVFVLLSLSLFGFYELQLPTAWQSRLNRIGRGREGSLIGAGLMGFVAALIAGPCLAPPLAGALLYIGASGNALLGGVALFALGIGMGIPLIILGTIGGGALPRAGAWMHEVKRFFGVILLGVAIWLLARILPGPVTLVLWAMLLAGYGIHLGAAEPLPAAASGGRRLAKAGGVLALVYAVILLVGAASGAANPLQPLRPLTAAGAGSAATTTRTSVFREVETPEQLQAALATAARNGRPAIVDFYADWCVECVRMKRTVFSDPRVRQALSDVVALKVDVTEYNAADQAIMRQYGVIGPPTMLFFAPSGQELTDYRLIGGVSADEFLAHLHRALGR